MVIRDSQTRVTQFGRREGGPGAILGEVGGFDLEPAVCPWGQDRHFNWRESSIANKKKGLQGTSTCMASSISTHLLPASLMLPPN